MNALLVSSVLALGALGLAGCGEGADSGSEELARQHEIAAARQQAAQDARQAERVKHLEREVAALKDAGEAAVAGAPPRTGPDSSDRPEGTTGDGWPGGSGYTVILASLSSEAEAQVTQGEASAVGLDAGILLSNNYGSLRPGYWVVFSGTFGTVAEATDRADHAHELGYADAYPRFVSP